MSKTNVCFITDENYAMPTMVAIESLIQNNSKNKFCVYIVAVNLSKENIANFNRLSTRKCKINIKEIDNAYANLGASHPHVSKAALLKFNLSDIFPRLNKLLYLDDDILVLGDLSELYNIKLGNNYAAVVPDIIDFFAGHDKRLGLKNYFNSGVMLLNTTKIRKDKISAKLLDYKLHKDTGHFMDQDCFNMVFNKNVKYVSLKYNMLLSYRNLEIKQMSDFYNLSTDCLKDIIEKPVVLHMAGYKDKLSLPGDVPESIILKKYFENVKNKISSKLNSKVKGNFLFTKEKLPNGRRHIYICGIKIASYKKIKH